MSPQSQQAAAKQLYDKSLLLRRNEQPNRLPAEVATTGDISVAVANKKQGAINLSSDTESSVDTVALVDSLKNIPRSSLKRAESDDPSSSDLGDDGDNDDDDDSDNNGDEY